jgi:dihydrofolate reductase
MQKAIIVAYANRRVIGSHGQIPWSGQLPADMARMVALTTGHALIMGRKTWESIPPTRRPLKNRQNIVVSRGVKRDANYLAVDPEFAGAWIARSLEEAYQLVEPGRTAWIFGGASLYRAGLSDAEKIYATEVHADFAGDTYFPEIDSREWREIAREDHAADDKNAYPYSFVEYEHVR